MSEIIAAATPESVGWQLLHASIIDLLPEESWTVRTATHESAVVVISGAVHVRVDGLDATINRQNVFKQLTELVYAPPSATIELTALTATQIGVGQAPAVGRYPPRIITPAEMEGVLRGGGPARRQVMSPLAGGLPAERLLVYEGWVPRGSWTGWPPHRHDGFADSPQLEETYYYRFDRPSGFGFHRNYAPERDWEDVHLLKDQTLVPVPHGYHLCGNGPAANMWLLNFLAGPVQDRDKPPFVDPAEIWIQDDWAAGAMILPAVESPWINSSTTGVST